VRSVEFHQTLVTGTGTCIVEAIDELIKFLGSEGRGLKLKVATRSNI